MTVATLYSYVSRGLVRSESTGADQRQRRYLREDVERLKERKAFRRDPKKAAASAIQWGVPVLESGVTLIANGRYYYRGRDAVELAKRLPFEGVAQALWDADGASNWDYRGLPLSVSGAIVGLGGLSIIERFLAILAIAQAADVRAHLLTPDAVHRTGARIIRLLARVATGDTVSEGTIATMLQQAWVPHAPRARALFDMALGLVADHELNVSSFTARCVASSGATPYAVVLGGLSALQGFRHGGAVERAGRFLEEVRTEEEARGLVEARLKGGESIVGFGHPLYPDGDPRYLALVDGIAALYPQSEGLARTQALVREVERVTGMHPTIDIGLAVLVDVLGLPRGAGIGIFALGRVAGWIAQATEQYELGTLIRPRATYTGIVPQA